jgi:hypothetical protein
MEGRKVGDAEPGAGAKTAAVLFLIAVFVVIALLIKALYPIDLPGTKSPNFIDEIFNNRLVIWAARLLLVSAAAVLAFGGLFIAVSIGIRMKNRHWLRRAGPFEISEKAVEEIEGQFEFWRDAALGGQAELAQLREQLEDSDELIEDLQTQLKDAEGDEDR